MKNSAFAAVTRLLDLSAALEESFSRSLGAVHGLSLRETSLLLHLDGAPGAKLSRVDLARRLHVSPATVTRMAAPLEKIGVIGREADARDARLAYVVLTEVGRRRVGEARTTLERLAAGTFHDRWSKDEIAMLAGLLGRLTAGVGVAT